MPICNDIIKMRDVCFSFTTGKSPASSARALLRDIDGITRLETRGEFKLCIEYDIRKLTLQMVENALREVGFPLRTTLWYKLRSAIVAYCEEATRERLGVNNKQSDSAIHLDQPAIYDPRPDNWRNYS